MTGTVSKVDWEGSVLSIQPRIRLTRSFDQRSHSYLGYVLRVRGTLAGERRDFVVALGKGAHEKHQFRAEDHVSGAGVQVIDTRLETADFYKVSKLKVIGRAVETSVAPPPFIGVPPALEIYRERGHRRLAAVTYSTKCTTCIWGCEMAVEMIIDPSVPIVVRHFPPLELE